MARRVVLDTGVILRFERAGSRSLIEPDDDVVIAAITLANSALASNWATPIAETIGPPH